MILIIQTVFSEIQIALCSIEGDLIKSKSWNSEKDEIRLLLPAIEELMEKRPYGELEKIVVVNGLGAFSSTRVGVTTANTLAMTTEAEIYGLTLDKEVTIKELVSRSLEVIAKELPAKAVIPFYRSEPMISVSKKKIFN